MKSIFPSAVLFFLVINLTFAQTKEQVAIKNALETLRVTLQKPTEAKLKAITHSQLSYGHSGGKIENQSQFIEAFVSGQSVFSNLEFSEIQIEQVGKTAIVRHILKSDTYDKGKAPGHVELKVMLVFTKIKSNWILVGRQAVKM
ncbi:nuclear transport factor 2 family protein [Lacihabitans sp. LS3-19]|uniref:nuclear transport factor 2 family protein n=1 Tax=Lacihabitans sp. LS3-19 TaxID=2487335 RepID=UPI0020CC858E|nr:nuclear transport factor 2 family protein [Lacihabitans sp. LS3-19]MCP9770545.1 nuclear transport factor 2 family protein [Lacihabitans sp. LS3-19]